MQCYIIGSPTCQGGKLVNCSDGEVCTTLIEEFTQPLTVSNTLLRSCGPPYQCNQNGSYTTADRRVRMSTSCCSTNNCTPEFPILPIVYNEKNGKICHSCVTGGGPCEGNETISCLGEETQCLRLFTIIKGDDHTVEAHHGCTTESVCDVRSKTVVLEEINVTSIFDCNSATRLADFPFFYVILLLRFLN
ncbi:phospholipase A2 inhibitor NAI-like [Hyperolius riggenbachi]|uniref:phospholipase A2 inhibitor NAI-like n=1 Tax=Hyperolius riggenbachi TaxID=752182 RepID=UPI0035A390C1